MACKRPGGEEGNESAKREPNAEPRHPKRRCVEPIPDELLNDWQRAVLSNDERVQIFATICEGSTTSQKVAEQLGKELKRVIYHVGVLLQRDLIEEDPSGQQCAAEDRFYRAAISCRA